MRIIFLGTGHFAVPALRALLRAGHTVTRAVSQPDRPAGRGKRLHPTPVRAAAEELGLPHVQTEDVNALDLAALVGDAEVGVIAAFGQKIGVGLLEALPRGCINIHGSLLPKYRGAAPYQWAIMCGETVTGVTVFQLNERWDAGPIWGRLETPIGETETADELHDRLAELGAGLIVDVVAQIAAGTATPQVQDSAQACRAPKLKKSDGYVDWSGRADVVVRRIHGLWSWPAAATEFVARTGKRERVQLVRARVAEALVDEPPVAPAERSATGQGTAREAVAPTAAEPGVVLADGTIQTGGGRVELLEVKPAGGKLMSYGAFVNGRHVQPPDRFVTLEPQ